jgi:long-chain acyl-CoA synthetase
MSGGRPFRWERSYPAGVSWDISPRVVTLPALLEESVAEHGPRAAIEFRGFTLTYRELGGLVDRAAAGFAALGAGPGTQVALYLPNSPWQPVALFGALKAGARVVQLSPLDAERELAHKLADSGARTLVTIDSPALLPMALRLLQGGALDRVVVGEDAAFGAPPEPPMAVPAGDPRVIPFAAMATRGAAAPPAAWPRLAPGDLALLQYTGGTTGAPKGAMLTHANLTAAVSIYNAWYEGQGLLRRGGEERAICVLPLFHIFALTVVLLRYLANGNQILLRARFDPEAALADIETRRATAFLGVPTMWIALAATPDLERRDLSSLRHLTSGGAPMPAEVAERFARRTGRRISGGWGMTETAPAGTHLPSDAPIAPGLIGLPLPGIEMDVVALDDPRRVLPPGETGELRIRGPNVTAGYWKRPEETEAAFVDGFFRTGDIGVMDEAGFIRLVDRRKDMIISSGFNVFPRIVEDAIYEHPDVEEAIVIGVPDAYRGEAGKVFVKLRAGAPVLTLEALRAFLADKLGRHELPAALEIRAALPRTAVGKLSKRALVDEERDRRAPPAPRPAA